MSKSEKQFREDLIDMKELLGIEDFNTLKTIPSYSIGMEMKKPRGRNSFLFKLGEKNISIY